MGNKITYHITFELEDYKKLMSTYPNFCLNYSSFEEWAQANIDDMLQMMSDVQGQKVTVIKTIEK